MARAKAALNVPVGLHRADEFLYKAVVQQGIAFGFKVEPQPPIDFYLDDGGVRGDSVATARRSATRQGTRPEACASRSDVTATPSRTLFVGDTLFAGGIGRTDLPGGDLHTLLASIRRCCSAFPDDTVVWPATASETTIGRERRTNPFLT